MRHPSPCVHQACVPGTSYLATGILVLGIAPFGIAATGDALREGVRNGTATKETEIISTNAHGLHDAPVQQVHHRRRRDLRLPFDRGRLRRQPAQEPVHPREQPVHGLRVRVQRHGRGERRHDHRRRRRRRQAAVHDQRHGRGHRPERRPRRRRRAAALKTRWLLVNEAGQIEEQSGGFTILDAYQTNQNVYIDSGSSLEGKGLKATIAIQNKLNVDTTDAAADPVFNGEVSVARCQTVAVECAPGELQDVERVRVQRRATATAIATAGTDANPRKRVYITITE